MKYDTLASMDTAARLAAADKIALNPCATRAGRALLRHGVHPRDYARGYVSALLGYTCSFSGHPSTGSYLVNMLQRQRRYSKEHNDVLTIPLRDRIKKYGPLQVLERSKKDQPGRLVSFEIECKLEPSQQVRSHTWPLMAGGVHAEHDGLEIPVVCRWDDLRPLYRVCAALRSFGARLTKSFGGHVHLDARDLYTGGTVPASLKKRINSVVVPGVERVLRWCVPASRVGNSYCQLIGADWHFSDRYRAVNVCSLHEHRTLEIRLGAASLNPDKWRLWAMACLYFFRAPIDKSAVAALSEIGTATEAADWIMQSCMEPSLKWWLLGRLRKFHPQALPDMTPLPDASGADV